MLGERKRVRDPEKLEFTIRGKALDELTEIAEREGVELNEVIKSALGLKRWAVEVKDDGDEVIVRHGKKDKYRLVV